MAFSRIVFTVLLVSVSCYASNVPVFLWGDLTKPIQGNPLKAIDSNKFASKIETIAKNSFTVVFIEPTLSPEDFSTKNAEGKSNLAQLAEFTTFSYLSAVEDPVRAIDENADPTQIDHETLTNKGLTAEIQPSNGKYLFIELKDAKEGETRAHMLERHSNFIEETYEKLHKEHGNVVGIYTGLYPSWAMTGSLSRVRRQAVASNESEDFILEGVRLYVELLQLNEDGKAVNLTNHPTSSMSIDSNNTHVMNTTVNFGDHSFMMTFLSQGGYWYFDSITFGQGTADEEVLYPTTEDLYSLMGFSYRCGQRTVFNNIYSNKTRTLTFNNLQIQPFFQPANESLQFGEAFDCVGFFSAPIWSGLMVTFILLAITFYGIIMMMDIKTMDRFDDPKGKTITINTAE